jgi:hypothetical protein
MPMPVLSNRQRADQSMANSAEGVMRALALIKAAKDEKDQKARQALQDRVTQQTIESNDMSLEQKRGEQGMVAQFTDRATRDATPGALGPDLPGEDAFGAPLTKQAGSDRFKFDVLKKLRVMRGQDPGDPETEAAARKAETDKLIGDAGAAPQLRKLHIDQGTAQIGATNAQAAHATAEAAKTKRETELLGQPKPGDALETAKFSRTLKQDFMGSQITKDFQIIERTSAQMKGALEGWKARATAAAKEGKTLEKGGIDQTLITLFNKLLDPSSVVRESEYARTPEGMAVLDRLAGQWEKFKAGGAGISDSFRDEIIASSDTLMKAAEEGFAKHVQDSIADAQTYGIEPARVVGGYSRYLDWKAPEKESGIPGVPKAGGPMKVGRFHVEVAP